MVTFGATRLFKGLHVVTNDPPLTPNLCHGVKNLCHGVTFDSHGVKLKITFRAKGRRRDGVPMPSEIGGEQLANSLLFSPREWAALSTFASSYEESKIVSNIYSRGYE